MPDHSFEKKIVDCLEPLLDDIVKLEKAHAGLDARFTAAVADAEKSIEALRDHVEATAKDAVAPEIDELRTDFNTAITSVKSLLDEQLRIVTHASREFDERMKNEQRRAADQLVAAAANYGA